ncbi:MAG: YmdB family metallophosphoesterase [Alphaproteobacteria bacterium]|nr:YmdB family metallophosphoesterase [Alphaproteobacteria bacterium]
MRILFCGDVVGRAGRRAIQDRLPALRRTLDVDIVIVNGENAAGGYGITAAICDEIFGAGADAITTGNHVWDQREIVAHFDVERRLLRPHNYPPGTPGSGAALIRGRDDRDVLVLHVMGRLYMDALDDPFAAVERELAACRLGETASAIVLDVHAEASSEKMALAHFVDGRVSLVVGTHTHVPTADAQILPGGTAYQTDAGMCGDYDSVIGMNKDMSVERFVRKMPTGRLEPAQGEATLCAVLVETDDRTGLARRIEPVRVGGRLAEQMPARATAAV